MLSIQGVTDRGNVNEFILLRMNWDLAKPNIPALFVHVKCSSRSLFFVHRTCCLILRVEATPCHQPLVSHIRWFYSL